MHVRLPFWIACCLLAMAVELQPAYADVSWSGAGYYLTELYGDPLEAPGFDVALVSGPYSNEGDCKSALGALSQDDQDDASCDYYATDPHAGGG